MCPFCQRQDTFQFYCCRCFQGGHPESRCSVQDAGGVHSYEIPGIIQKLNRMPMGALEYAYPIEALRAMYGASTEVGWYNGRADCGMVGR